ncbi:MAG: YkgJ family cysteine cluster protein [Hyphomicrobiaceae bacterium]
MRHVQCIISVNAGGSTVSYDCLNCPGYCCSYPVIQLTKRDVARLARHHGITPAQAAAKFTKADHGHKRIMKRKKDEHFGRICRFFDTEARRCTVYQARPEICRAFPNEERCGYYDFLEFERRHQDDPAHVAQTDSSAWK